MDPTCPFSVPCGALVGVLTVLFLASTLYAVALEWAERRYSFTSDYTWLTVVIGVALTLAGLAVLDPRAAGLALLLFVVTGIPMIGRAIIVDVRNRQRTREAYRDKA